MEKLVYLIWDRPSRDPQEVHRVLLEDVGPQLLALGARGLEVHVDDADAQVPSMVPVPDDELPVRACVSLWVDAHDFRAPFEDALRDVGIRRAGYLVTEAMYRDYGDNEHAPRREWPDGERSPGITTLTVFDKRADWSDDAFLAHWYGHQGPMSEWMQPRCRYVRNTVVRGVTPGAPPYRAIVAENWWTVEHLTDIRKFFGCDDGDDLGERIRIMLDSTKLLFDASTMRNYTLSEYILRSPGG